MSYNAGEKSMFCVNARYPLASTGVTLLQRLIRRIALVVLAFTTLLSTPAHAEWREATSEHFVILSEGSERELVRTAQRLEAVHWLLTQATNRRDALEGQRVRVYLVDNPIMLRAIAGVPERSNVIAIYMGSPIMPTALAVRDRPQSDLYHEYGHHFMRQYMPSRLPGWFVEGFAEVVSTASFELEGRITYGKVANDRQYELQDTAWTPMARLFAEPGDNGAEGNGSHAGIASYGQYWVTTHYLLFAPERRGQLARYIAAITRGDDSLVAAEAAFPGGLEQLDRDVRAYLRRADFQYRPVPLPEGVMRSPTVRTIRSGEAAALRLEMESARTWGVERNTGLLPRVAALAAQHPQEPAVHALHASVLIGTEQYPQAIEAADRGISIDAGHARSNALRAYAKYRAGSDEGLLRSEDISEIRTYADRARATDPREPALALTAPLLRQSGAAMRAARGEGDDASESATARPRGRMVVTSEQGEQLNRAFRLMREDQTGPAREIFAGIAASAPEAHVGRYSAAMVAWIDGGRRGGPPGMTDSQPGNDDAADED